MLTARRVAWEVLVQLGGGSLRADVGCRYSIRLCDNTMLRIR